MSGRGAFSDQRNQALITLSQTCASLSFIGSLVIIMSYLRYPQMRKLSYELVTWLAVADLLANVSYFLGNPYGNQAKCKSQAVIQQFFQVGLIQWTVVIAMAMRSATSAMKVVKHSRASMWHRHAYVWGCATLFTVLPATTQSYGPAGAWCWIQSNSSFNDPGTWWRLFAFYIPLWFAMAFVLFAYFSIVRTLTQHMRMQESIGVSRSRNDTATTAPASPMTPWRTRKHMFNIIQLAPDAFGKVARRASTHINSFTSNLVANAVPGASGPASNSGRRLSFEDAGSSDRGFPTSPSASAAAAAGMNRADAGAFLVAPSSASAVVVSLDGSCHAPGHVLGENQQVGKLPQQQQQQQQQPQRRNSATSVSSGGGGSRCGPRRRSSTCSEGAAGVAKFVQRVKYYPMLFIFCWIWASINRVQQIISPNNPIFALYVLQTSTVRIQGFLNALAYGWFGGIGELWRAEPWYQAVCGWLRRVCCCYCSSCGEGDDATALEDLQAAEDDGASIATDKAVAPAAVVLPAAADAFPRAPIGSGCDVADISVLTMDLAHSSVSQLEEGRDGNGSECA